MSLKQDFTRGIFAENPTFRLILGMCPTLAVSTSLINAIGMGAATTFVLLGSNILVSLFRKLIPSNIRIPTFIVIIATFVT
ncbi:electron transport complex subunit RsxE, partial [bacterium]|nr:electron transport complex subunit RsxE [bacterium]